MVRKENISAPETRPKKFTAIEMPADLRQRRQYAIQETLQKRFPGMLADADDLDYIAKNPHANPTLIVAGIYYYAYGQKRGDSFKRRFMPFISWDSAEVAFRVGNTWEQDTTSPYDYVLLKADTD